MLSAAALMDSQNAIKENDGKTMVFFQIWSVTFVLPGTIDACVGVLVRSVCDFFWCLLVCFDFVLTALRGGRRAKNMFFFGFGFGCLIKYFFDASPTLDLT